MDITINTRQFTAGFITAIVVASFAVAFFFMVHHPITPQTRTIIYRDAPAPTGPPDVSVNISIEKKGDCIMISKPGEKEAQLNCVMV